jgi:hypothetical protein
MIDEKEIVGHTLVEDKRHKAIKDAFDKYTVSEFKAWAVDTMAELIQQVTRLRTERCDKEELVESALMVEDAVCMLWMLLKSDAEMIHKIKDRVYSEFQCEIKRDKPMGQM